MARWTTATTSCLISGILLTCGGCDGTPSDTTPAQIDSGVGMHDAGMDVDDSGAADGQPDPCSVFDELVTREALLGHLEQLEQIARDNDNNRAVGTPGFEASLGYVRDQLEAAGYSVSTPSFDYSVFRFLGPGTLEVLEPISRSYQAAIYNLQWGEAPGDEFVTCQGSPPGDVTAELVAVDLKLGPNNASTSACEDKDFDDKSGGSIVAGKIALIQRGTCPFDQKVQNAQDAGALGVVLFNQGDTLQREGLLVPQLSGLGEDHGITIPVVFATTAVGEELAKLLHRDEVTLHLVTDTRWSFGQSQNLVLDIAGSVSDEVIMFGAHLDSKPEGPGINDNATGSAAVLEIAKQLQVCPPARSIRLAWWSAEEEKLQGSTAYVLALTGGEIAKLRGYVNLDMLGSINHIYQISDGDGSASETAGPGTSAELEAFFVQDFETIEEPIVDRPIHVYSDHAPFYLAGIGIADLNAGVGWEKSDEEAEIFGGTAGAPYDPCFHKLCDDLSNIDVDVLETITKSAARAVQHFGIEGQGLASP